MTTDLRPRGGAHRGRTAAAIAALVVGLVLTVLGWSRFGPPLSPSGDGTGSPRPGAAGAPLPRSLPTRIQIPAIGVDAPVLSLGLNADGTVREPSLSTPHLTSWFKEGPSPGERGPSAFYGHVDSHVSGPAVFYRLGELRPGSLVRVSRRDGRTAVFSVDSVERHAKARFPTERVYGPTSVPTIRVMTCGGRFDPVKRSYVDNIIVFGTLTDSPA